MEKHKQNGAIDLSEIRSRLSESRGRQYWRSLEELAGTEEFNELLHREFPEQASVWADPVSRRNFLKLMGASLALAGLGACTSEPDEKIVPYVRAPEEFVPGMPLYFATAFTLGGIATGVLAESHMGRPTKIEGNPEHPASLGATDSFAQASVLTLYDPDRSQVVTKAGRISTWNAFLAAMNTKLEGQRLSRGAGLRVLTETVTSPTLAHQIQKLMQQFPEAKWHQYEPLARDNVIGGAKLAFGQAVNTTYRFDRAEIVLSLNSDFLSCGPGNLRYAREFVAKRQPGTERGEMNRLYVVESTPSLTGAVADHRWPLSPYEIEHFARAVAHEIGVNTDSTPETVLSSGRMKNIAALARDLEGHRGTSIVLAGAEQPPFFHALAHAINQKLENVGKTVIYSDPIEANPTDQMESLGELVRDMEAGSVEMLIIVGGNPVYTAPVDLDFSDHLAKIDFRIHLGLYEDETSELCHWHIPETHYLESWSDARAYDGTVTILQPLIAPLYQGKSAHELISVLMGNAGISSYEILRDFWTKERAAEGFETFWRKVLHDGLIPGSALPPISPSLQPTGDWGAETSPTNPQNGLEIIFRPDPTIWDGRFANNGWLQELPDPMTKLTWDNAALTSPATAQRLAVKNGELVELRYLDRSVRAPIWIAPGHADDSVTVNLGYGRTRSGKIGTGTGFNAYQLRTSNTPWFGRGLEVRRTGREYPLATTQNHHSIEGRNLIRTGTIDEFRKHPDFVHEMAHEPSSDLSMYPPHKYGGYAWGMSIDLNACIGCSACVVACQAENNIPVVGKTEVARGRVMHWLRIDRYYQGDLDDPATHHQPVPCMHCENAPCEPVCPVGATVHSSEGLNDMVYNRCVGTRYCSNNCPFKVRRFNFFQYSDYETESKKLLRNPDVTVRTRGVMEKCTYCVQRISAAKIEAEKEDRKVSDGEIVTACQQACPTQAIVFGDLNDPTSRVSKLKKSPLNYGLLPELNVRPRTTYQAKLKNPNPEIETE